MLMVVLVIWAMKENLFNHSKGITSTAITEDSMATTTTPDHFQTLEIDKETLMDTHIMEKVLKMDQMEQLVHFLAITQVLEIIFLEIVLSKAVTGMATPIISLQCHLNVKSVQEEDIQLQIVIKGILPMVIHQMAFWFVKYVERNDTQLWNVFTGTTMHIKVELNLNLLQG